MKLKHIAICCVLGCLISGCATGSRVVVQDEMGNTLEIKKFNKSDPLPCPTDDEILVVVLRPGGAVPDISAKLGIMDDISVRVSLNSAYIGNVGGKSYIYALSAPAKTTVNTRIALAGGNVEIVGEPGESYFIVVDAIRRGNIGYQKNYDVKMQIVSEEKGLRIIDELGGNSKRQAAHSPK